MTLSKTLIPLLFGGSLACASSLSVYQDKTFYTYVPTENFIGFAKSITAKCEGSTVALEAMHKCPEEQRLCKVFLDTRQTENQIKTVQSNREMLNKLIALPQPTTVDAQNWIASAKLLGEEQSRLSQEEADLAKAFRMKEQLFNKQAPQKEAKQSQALCQKDFEVTIPYGYVSFSTGYEANIGEGKEITVTQKLSIVNRSGIDINSDTVMFYYRSANPYVRPTHFYPWTVSKYVPRPKRSKKTMRMKKEARSDSMLMMSADMSEEVVAMDVPAPVASYEDAREYKVTNLHLPSTGEPFEMDVLRWKAPLKCEIKAYPYTNVKAFEVCSFKPSYQIDQNQWKVKNGSEVINERATGEYRGERYQIYTKIEDDINIMRLPIVQKERETGIFGGTARKKDGYKLILINKSNKEKTLTVIERMPTSTTDEIKVKLLSIKSKNNQNYKLLENGKIEMKVTLAPQAKKEIEILFEMSYDKDIKINY